MKRPNSMICIEAESFEHIGGWVIDTQFIDLMGSPYLMANGMGKPAKDAETEIEISEPGKYRLWARTRDWFPEAHPGIFQIMLNGKPSEHIFAAMVAAETAVLTQIYSGETSFLLQIAGLLIERHITRDIHQNRVQMSAPFVRAVSADPRIVPVTAAGYWVIRWYPAQPTYLMLIAAIVCSRV